MLTCVRETFICAEHRDGDCDNCPLKINDEMCKENSHWSVHRKRYVLDEELRKNSMQPNI